MICRTNKDGSKDFIHVFEPTADHSRSHMAMVLDSAKAKSLISMITLGMEKHSGDQKFTLCIAGHYTDKDHLGPNDKLTGDDTASGQAKG